MTPGMKQIFRSGIRSVAARRLRNSAFTEALRRARRCWRLVGAPGRRMVVYIQTMETAKMFLGTLTLGLTALLFLLLNDLTVASENSHLAKAQAFLGVESGKRFLILFCVFFIFYIIIVRVLVVAMAWATKYLKLKLSRIISSAAYGHYITWNYRYLTDRDNNVLIQKVQSCAGVVFSAILPPISAMMLLLNFSIVLVGLMYINFGAMLILLIGSTLFYVIYYNLVKGRIYRYGREKYHLGVGKLKLLRSGLSPFVDVMFGGLDKEFRMLYRQNLERKAFFELRMFLIGSFSQPFLRVLGFIFVCLLVIYLLSTGASHEILPTVAVFILAGFRLISLGASLQNVLLKLKESHFMYYSIIGELETALAQEEKRRELDKLDPLGFRESVVLENVSFSYPGQKRPALHNIQLELKTRQQVALCGFSGGGKTTLARTLCGLIQPDKGRVLVDGRDVWTDLKTRRRWHFSIGMLQQQPFFLEDTIAANVVFSLRPESVDKERVLKALAAAQLGEFVDSLPQGINTVVGENALRLSGGQGQRLSIARSLYNKVPLLILDETTSALDAITERKILEGPMFNDHDHATLVIAHRTEIMKKVDKIYVMADGEIVAQGVYEELLRTCRLFRQLARKETPEDEAAEQALAEAAGSQTSPG